MNIPADDPRLKKTITNVGLITSNGSFGHNIMACEYTYLFSFEPALIALGIRSHKATAINIRETKMFGVNICAEDQNVISSIAGNNTAKNIDKIGLLKEVGAQFYQATTMDILMLEGASMNAECKLVEILELGDHPLLIGEIEHITSNDKQPLSYFQGRYHKVGEEIQKPDQEYRERIKKMAEKFKKQQ